MVAELEAMRDLLANGGKPVRVIDCPVCGEATRVDRLITEHRACLDVPIAGPPQTD
jgi:hypothetical protein